MSDSCLHRCRARFNIDLHPSTSGDVLKGVREQLALLLVRYIKVPLPPHLTQNTNKPCHLSTHSHLKMTRKSSLRLECMGNDSVMILDRTTYPTVSVTEHLYAHFMHTALPEQLQISLLIWLAGTMKTWAVFCCPTTT